MGHAPRHALRLLACLFLLAGLPPASAQDLVRNISSEYARVVDRGNAVGASGDGLFGDHTSLYTGETEFRAIDIDLPGNDALPVQFARRFAVEETQLQSFDRGALGNWEIDVPYLSGLFTREHGWQVDGAAPLERCSRQQGPRVGSGFSAAQFWYGVHLHVPGEGDQELLVPTAQSLAGPAAGGPYKWLTKGQWFFACLPSLRNGDGEGFLAISPAGVKYTFDWLVARDAASVTRPALTGCLHTVWVNPFTRGAGEYERAITSPDFLGTGVSDGVKTLPCTDFILRRSEVRLYVTRVEDRFGNRVDYTWEGDRLRRIAATDDRAIDLAYDDDGYVATATTGASVWRYAYDDHQLTGVTLPDASRWTFASNSPPGLGAFLVIEHDYESPPLETNTNCLWPGYGGREFVYTVTHPSGAVGEFRFAPNRIPRTYAPRQCLITTGTAGYFFHPPYSDVYSILARRIAGPGVPEQRWTYAYEGNGGTPLSFQAFCTNEPQAPTCTPWNTTVVRDPTGVTTRHQFGNKHEDTEGQLQAVRVHAADGTLVSETVHAYASPAANPAHAFADRAGNSLQARGSFGQEAMRPVARTLRNLDGVDYIRETVAFDAYALPLRVRRTSALGTAEDRLDYEHNVTAWVLGQVRTMSTGDIEVGRTAYDPVTALPVASYVHGTLEATFGHRADGTPAWIRDARGNQYSLSAHRRGIAQAITFPDATAVSAVVDNLGRLASRKDAYGSQWTYGRDALGRLKSVAYPTGDGIAWAPTTYTFLPVPATELGLPAGHWRRTEQTGTGRTTTYFDALWRPVVTLAEDTTNAATRSYVVRRFDAAGREVFVSYPAASLATYLDNVPGTRTAYDPLGRVVRVEQDSELGVLATTTRYLAGGAVRVTDPMGRVATTRHQAFDAPDASRPVAIDLPLGVEVRIERDVFGKPLAITRRGPYDGTTLSATRRYVYDANQRLCKAIHPESGAEVFAYDEAGNVAWSAAGTTLTSAACDRDAAPLAMRVARTYDALNRVRAVATPDGNGNLTTVYTADGLVQSLAATNPGGAPVTTTYTYNKRRLMTTETASQPNWYAWTIGYGYDANANMSTLTYPGGLSVAYAPNALGQPTRAGAFATGVAWHPDGSLKGLTYGNGIVRTLARNLRGLPSRAEDRMAGVVVIDDAFAYDRNGNLTDITDSAQAGATTRGMAYDDLDRLTAAVAPAMWGDAWWAYDPLDNLRVSHLGDSGFSYSYDAANRLTSLLREGGGAYAYQADARGNITSDGRRAYVFDHANRLSAVSGKENYRYDGLGRRALSTRAGSVTLHQYDAGGRLLAQHDTRRGTRTSHVYLGDTLVAESAQPLGGGAAVVRYVHTDFQRTPVAKTDAAGAVVERTAYTPFGAPFDRPVDGPGYTGHAIDVDTGLVYAQQRYYDPLLGRFLSTDPTATGAAGDNFNRYWYADNDPYGNRDPDGRATCANATCTMSYIGQSVRRTNGQPPTVNGEIGLGGDRRFVARAMLANKAVTVTFVNDNPAGASPNQAVTTPTALMMEEALGRSSADSVNINSTTGGAHAPRSRHRSGRAIDINRIDGARVDSEYGAAASADVQRAAAMTENVRENFGPALLQKTVSAGAAAQPVVSEDLAKDHRNHVHLSGQR